MPEVADALSGAGDQAEAIFGEPQHGEVAEEAAAVVEHRGVDELPGSDVDVVGAEAVEDDHGVRARDLNLAEARLVEQRDRLAARQMLGAVLVPPGLATERVLDLGRRTRVAEEVGALKAGLLAEPRAVHLDHVVYRRGAQRAPRQELTIGVGHQIVRPECLGDALTQVRKVVLLGREAGRVDHAQVERRVALDQP